MRVNKTLKQIIRHIEDATEDNNILFNFCGYTTFKLPRTDEATLKDAFSILCSYGYEFESDSDDEHTYVGVVWQFPTLAADQLNVLLLPKLKNLSA